MHTSNLEMKPQMSQIGSCAVLFMSKYRVRTHAVLQGGVPARKAWRDTLGVSRVICVTRIARATADRS